jgi:hypothetical protein
MDKNESYATEIWLITGIFHSLPGLLSLENGRLIFTALGPGTYWESGLKKIEKKAEAENFCTLLKRNKTAQLFNIDVDEIQKITYPFIYFSCGAHLFFRNQKYRLSFIEPNNTKLPVMNKTQYGKVLKRNIEIITDISHARRVGKKWKSLLAVEKYNL